MLKDNKSGQINLRMAYKLDNFEISDKNAQV